MEFNKTMGGNKVKKIGVFCKPKAPSAIDILGRLIPWLRKQNCHVFLDTGTAAIINETSSYEKREISRHQSDAFSVFASVFLQLQMLVNRQLLNSHMSHLAYIVGS